ncbi:MAG: formimidoylglutamase [Chitinophagaceae bacterium]|jgi:formiminoglutamase|nr:formimidoylglutamase [Chitinophagaceae bacterium]
MRDSLLTTDFLQPLDLSAILGDDELNDAQLGHKIKSYTFEFPDIDDADIVILGMAEERGTGNGVSVGDSPALIRKNLYRLYNWHPDVQLADIGNIKSGASLNDTYAAAKAVIAELIAAGKTVIILGGSHDLTLAQYGAYVQREQIIEASCVDAFINLSVDTPLRSENFLMEMLTGEPNFIRHYNHIGFQSYFVHPNILQTMDRLRFDCFRVGVVKDALFEMEPVIRSSQMLSIDLSAMSHAYAPANKTTPNGLNGEEMCTLTQYAGMSEQLNTLGLYGYNAKNDVDELTAIQIAQMIWYFIDGKSKSKTEPSIKDRQQFTEYHTTVAGTDTVFLQSKRTARWWMQLPNQKFIACSAADYQLAIHSEIPERWLRAQERD